MPYVLIDKCPTHVLRTKLATFNIECKNKRRNELISLLKSRGVLILEAQNVSESHSTKSFIMCSNPSYSDIPHGDCLTTSSVDRNDDWVLIDGSKSVDYESPTKVPIETLAKRPTPKYSDAIYGRYRVEQLRNWRKFVCEFREHEQRNRGCQSVERECRTKHV
jgi:hypothetical protein